ncbi:LysR family transcriptional regulator [Parendozoicomonas haliclonae]|uniref:Nodulation protein D 2 n=1 Tax=Parendozoicomonas haliclonae TaxID=1960125 RepID=A0A1X7AHG6_9GAMM|nr:LysR family transcriptional regulator [Parendozoicomonas haliclonae]SMA42750.1 Nodulation protein D 2 [Parendozoicomonas haliclonae]
MAEFNWRSVDLNLLRTFDALMTCRSVSRAAAQLHIGQSAMSYNLGRLRQLLNDPLFERQGHEMVPTRRAEELSDKVRLVLTIVRDEIITTGLFDPLASKERIVIGLNDYSEMVFGPALLDRLFHDAPQAPVIFRAIDDGNCQQAVESGEVDLAIGTFETLGDSLSRAVLYREKHVCLFDNEVLNLSLPISLEDYIATPQAMITAGGELRSRVDKALADLGCQRRVVLGSSRFLSVRNLLSGRRLICVMAEMVGRASLFEDQLTLCEPPVPVSDFDIEMVVRHRDKDHPRLQWLMAVIEDVICTHLAVLRGESETIEQVALTE